MKIQSTFVNIVALLLVIAGVVMRIYSLPDEQLSLMVSLSGLLLYLLARHERRQTRHRNISND